MDKQIRADVERLKADPIFGLLDKWWLTFYLSGSPEKLRCVVASLAQMEAQNLTGEESGFLYPKLQVQSSADDVAWVIRQVAESCDSAGVELLGIDADTGADVSRSKFSTLR